MDIRTTLVTAPVAEALTVAEVKLDRVIDHDLHDDLFVQYIQAAREVAEMRTSRALMPQAWQQLCVNADTEIPLEKWPAQAIASISINGETIDHAQMLEDGTLFFGAGDNPFVECRLFKGQRVVIQYTAGYDNAAAVPAAIKKWMLLQIGSMYEHRESTVVGTNVQRVSYADSLIMPFTVRGYA